MVKRGKVLEIKDSGVIVVPRKDIACFGCMNQECRSSGIFIAAKNPLTLSLKKGQEVEIKAPGASILGQALTALLPPVLGFILGFFLIRRFFPMAGEGAAAGAGTIFLFAAAGVIYAARKKFPAGTEYTVMKIIE